MGAGKWLILGVLIGFIMFRLFAGVIAIFRDEVGSFWGGLVETVKDREHNEGIVEDDTNCVLATDEDFSGIDNGELRYKGSSDCVKIPHVIKDEEMTSYHKITDMSYMFNSNQDTEVDLSNFNTSDVIDMSYMFEGSQATEIKGLENFDT